MSFNAAMRHLAQQSLWKSFSRYRIPWQTYLSSQLNDCISYYQFAKGNSGTLVTFKHVFRIKHSISFFEMLLVDFRFDLVIVIILIFNSTTEQEDIIDIYIKNYNLTCCDN